MSQKKTSELLLVKYKLLAGKMKANAGQYVESKTSLREYLFKIALGSVFSEMYFYLWQKETKQTCPVELSQIKHAKHIMSVIGYSVMLS